ncbi:hypothetical protein KJ708_10515, partial [bacterium]|nr:hypothetical protein [bacterium]MBU1916757.1 hypothetical protein [bacterium]
HDEQTIRPVLHELDKARHALQIATEKSTEARRYLRTHDDRAKDIAIEANRHIATAIAEIEDVNEEIVKLNEAKIAFEKEWNNAGSTRNIYKREIEIKAPTLSQNDDFIHEHLKRGDRLFTELRKLMQAKQKNYAQLSLMLKDVFEKWKDGVTQAERAQKKHDQEQNRAETERRRNEESRRSAGRSAGSSANRPRHHSGAGNSGSVDT